MCEFAAVRSAHLVDQAAVVSRAFLYAVGVFLVVVETVVDIPQEAGDDDACKRTDGRAEADETNDGFAHAADFLFQILLVVLVLCLVPKPPLVAIDFIPLPTLVVALIEIIEPILQLLVEFTERLLHFTYRYIVRVVRALQAVHI